MASPVRPSRRNSMGLPTNMSSEINQLNEELNRLHEDVAPQIQQHVKKVKNLSNGSKNDYWGSVTGGIMALVGGLAIVLYHDDDAIFGIAVAIVVAGFVISFRQFKKQLKKKNLVQAVEEEHIVYQDNANAIIDMLERLYQRSNEILRDFFLIVQNARVLHQRFAAFETMRLFQRVELYEEADQKSKIVHLSGNLSEMIRKVSSVSDILKEISDDNKRRKYSDQKEKTERFINDMLREFGQIKDAVNETRLIADRISNTFHST